MYVFVVDQNQNPLMPTSPGKARRLIKCGKATPFFKKGIFCIRLNYSPSTKTVQPIAVGVDPGSKMEGFSVVSENRHILNIQAEAVTFVKDKIETRRNMRRGRRFRKTPCRKNRINRKRSPFPPSTKARWDWKLRILNVLRKVVPIAMVVVEDVMAKTKKGKRNWNKNFSPLEVGKKWFYDEISQWAVLVTKKGFDTYQSRNAANLRKNSDKLSEDFFTHCVDSFVLACLGLGIDPWPTNQNLICIFPRDQKRRQLHRFQPKKGGIREKYGSTRSYGLKRGSLVEHPKHGRCIVGGFFEKTKRISLHRLSDNSRICQNAKPEDCKFKTFNMWQIKRVEGKPSIGESCNRSFISDKNPEESILF